MHFLITAGPTKEYIDPVRFISNASSGQMGYALAQTALTAGHKVTLITTIENSKLKTKNPKLLKVINVQTTKQMFTQVKKHFSRCNCLIMAAAVADYTVDKPAKNKIKKTDQPLNITLNPTPDILKWAGKNKKKQIVAGFALEDKAIKKNAEKKLTEKNLDMIIANKPSVIGSDKTEVLIKTPTEKWQNLPQAAKVTVAKKIISFLEKL